MTHGPRMRRVRRSVRGGSIRRIRGKRWHAFTVEQQCSSSEGSDGNFPYLLGAYLSHGMWGRTKDSPIGSHISWALEDVASQCAYVIMTCLDCFSPACTLDQRTWGRWRRRPWRPRECACARCWRQGKSRTPSYRGCRPWRPGVGRSYGESAP
jgi:hypothetical protein